jgi:hypothetical protein
MKNYKVRATRFFKDSSEIDEKTGLKTERKVNDEFFCTKERYEFLKANNAVKLVEVVEEITEEEVQAVANAIAEEAIEQDKTVEEIVNEIVEESKEEVNPKPKKKKTSKK